MPINWRDVVGYEGLYQVSDQGQIYSIKSSKLLKQIAPKGYYIVNLWKGKKQSNFRVNRLVAITWLPNPKLLPQVNHVDGVKTNNEVSNLEWVTDKQNKEHAKELDLYYKPKGEKHSQNKLEEWDIHFIRHWLYCGYSQAELGRVFGVGAPAIFKIHHKQRWKHVKETL